jgi:hypothetical protein
MTTLLLDKKSIAKIRKMIITWGGNFTWDGLVLAIKNDLGIKISRVSLKGYGVIYAEYLRKKDAIRGVVNVSDDPLTVADSNTISKLEKKLAESLADADMYKRDYDKAQILIQRVIVNAQSIPNLDVNVLFADIDLANDN